MLDTNGKVVLAEMLRVELAEVVRSQTISMPNSAAIASR